VSPIWDGTDEGVVLIGGVDVRLTWFVPWLCSLSNIEKNIRSLQKKTKMVFGFCKSSKGATLC